MLYSTYRSICHRVVFNCPPLCSLSPEKRRGISEFCRFSMTSRPQFGCAVGCAPSWLTGGWFGGYATPRRSALSACGARPWEVRAGIPRLSPKPSWRRSVSWGLHPKQLARYTTEPSPTNHASLSSRERGGLYFPGLHLKPCAGALPPWLYLGDTVLPASRERPGCEPGPYPHVNPSLLQRPTRAYCPLRPP